MSKSTRWKVLPDNLKGRVINADPAITQKSVMQSQIMDTKQPQQAKISKYRNKKCVYHAESFDEEDITFDSQKEMKYYLELKMLMRAGEITSIKLQPDYPYYIRYINPFDPNRCFEKRGKYIADFLVTYKDGHKETIDVKGYRTPKFRRDKRIMKAIYGIEVIEK